MSGCPRSLLSNARHAFKTTPLPPGPRVARIEVRGRRVGRSDGGGSDVETHAKVPLSFKLLAGERVVQHAVKVKASVPAASKEDLLVGAKQHMGEIRDTNGTVAFPGSRNVAAVRQVLRSIGSACRELGRV